MTRMPMNGIHKSSIVALLFCLFGCAAGLSDSQANRDPGSRNVELAIQEHTLAIRAGHLSGENLANAYRNRGNAYADKNDYERALQDLNEAIRINVNYGDAYNDRGVVYRRKHEYDRAITDFDEAIRLNP